MFILSYVFRYATEWLCTLQQLILSDIDHARYTVTDAIYLMQCTANVHTI